MRVLIHSRSFLPRLGGLEQSSLALARALRRHGHQVVVATDVAADAATDAQFDVQVVRQASLRDLVGLARAAHLVHANGQSLVTWAVAELAGRPLIVTHHGYQSVCLSGLGWHGGCRCDYVLDRCVRLTAAHEGPAMAARQLLRHLVVRATLGRAAAHVAVSRFVAGTLRIPNIEVVYNAADRGLFRPTPAQGARDSFLFVGRLVGEKGVPCLLEAFARYLAGGGSCGLDIVGSGPEESLYRLKVADLRIEASVSFRGALHGEALAEAYRESLAVLVPSVWDEAFGIVAAEAACSGRVAIVSRAGGLPEVVEEEATAPPGDVGAWAEAMHRLERDRPWREALEARLPAVAERFSLEAMAKGYLAIYERVLASPLHSPPSLDA